MSSHETRTRPVSSAQGQAFPNPLSINHIVWVLSIQAQRHPWVVKNCVLTIGAVCGKGLRVGADGGGFKPLSSRSSRSFLHLQRHAVVAPTQTSARGYALQCQWHGQP